MGNWKTGRISEMQAQLAAFSGGTLHWWYYTTSHQTLWLLVTDSPAGPAELGSIATRFIECPVWMHNIRLRGASEEETEGFRLQLPVGFRRYLERDDHLIVECDEGKYTLWLGSIAIRNVEHHDPDHIAESELLWDG